MQIQKGLVKYKDRSDIVCTYGLTDDGKQYYFLDNSSITNGNIIASTVLVEAIDPVVVASSIGVIDSNGNEIIPFEYKSIKPISEGLLLVEVANSTTPSVVEAISLRSDPLSATKLVTTPATIKDKMNAKMGSEGRFVFNDQFSEATIFDVNGNNLIDNQFFSFIGIKNNETLYFSKNTVDSPVLEFSLADKKFVQEVAATSPVALDVQNVVVEQGVIDNVMNNQETSVMNGDITAKDFEEQNVSALSGDSALVEEPLTIAPTVVEPSSLAVNGLDTPLEPTEEVVVSEEENIEEPEPVIPEKVEPPVEEPVQVEPASEEKVEESSLPAVEEPVVVEDSKEKTSESIKEPENKSFEQPITEEFVDVNAAIDKALNEDDSEEKVEKNKNESSDKLMSFDFGDNINYDFHDEDVKVVDDIKSTDDVVDEFKKDLYDVDLDSDIFANSTLHLDKIDVNDSYDYTSYGYRSGNKDTIIEDVASTMTNLINLNRSQRQKIVAYEEKFEQAAAAHKKVVEKARSQIRDIETLKGKLKNYETIVTKLEAKISVLENKVHDQDKVIASQARELESLRPQIEGKEELAKILADAQSLLEQE